MKSTNLKTNWIGRFVQKTRNHVRCQWFCWNWIS